MNLEKFDKRVGVYVPTETTNAIGETIETFALSTTYWMQMDTEAGSEVFTTGKEINKYVTNWIMRTATMDETYRLLYNSNYYDILAIEEIDRYFIRLKTVRHGEY